MNLAMVSSPNFGSGRIIRFGTSRRLGISFQFHYQRTVATAGQTVQFLGRRTGFLLTHVATILIAHRTGATDSSHRRLLPPERNHTVRQLFVANSVTLPSRLLWRPLFFWQGRLYHRGQSAMPAYLRFNYYWSPWSNQSKSRVFVYVTTSVVSRRISSGPVADPLRLMYLASPVRCDSAHPADPLPCHPG